MIYTQHNMKSLEEYDISPITGFLPSDLPLQRLENPYFKPWEDLISNLPGLLLIGKLRESVHKIPLLDHTSLKNKREYRRAFVILCALSHGYIWNDFKNVSEILPKNLSIPWCAVSKKLDLCPISCYANTVLWNYKKLDHHGPLDLSNLSSLNTFSGTSDETWFNLIMVAIESEGALCIPAMIRSIQHVHDDNYKDLYEDLRLIHTLLVRITDVIGRVYEKCDPYVFYNTFRQFFAGWKNMAEFGLPNGVIYVMSNRNHSPKNPHHYYW